MFVFQFDHLVGTRGAVRREKKSFFSLPREIRLENSLYNFIRVLSNPFSRRCYYNNNNNNTCVVYFYLPPPIRKFWNFPKSLVMQEGKLKS